MSQHLGPARWCLVLVLAALTTCRLDKLIKPKIADRLAVTPDSLQDSAHFGSSNADTLVLRIASADGATLPWTASDTVPWLTLTPTTGGAPDSVIVILAPVDGVDTLPRALHQTTIILTSPVARDTVRVPVRFNILPPAPELVVAPTSAARTALVRSALPLTLILGIDNTGSMPLTWSATSNVGWLTFGRANGGALPQQHDSAIVTLTPGALATGTHTGAVTITASAGTVGSPFDVPVTFTIQPCAEPAVVPDAIVTSSVTLADCGAPQRPGSHAKVYAVQATAGDTLSFRLSAAFDEYLVLTNSAGTSVLDQNDECPELAGTACITFPVTATGRYLIEATSAAAAATGAFTLSVVRERAPSTPQSIGQFRSDSVTALGPGTTTPENVVVLKGTLNDPNPGDSVRLEIELVGALSGPKTDSSAFVAVAAGGVPVAVHATGLIDNEAYRWRARTCDKTGRCSAWLGYGNPDPAVDFYVNSVLEAPAAPTLLKQFDGAAEIPIGGGTGGGGLVGSTEIVTFTAVVSDPDPGDLVSIEVEVKVIADAFNGTTNLSRGGLVASSTTASRAVEVQAPGLFGRNDYHWRARACDQTNRCGAWVSFGNNSETQADFTAP